jgi:O-acetyl-ADP-ribose deacetylase
MKINVIEGDITQIKVDAIMTAINSGKMWFGGIDAAIQRVAGNTYHPYELPLSNLNTIFASGSRDNHQGQFNHIVFVVDDLESKLREVIYHGLVAANDNGVKTIAIPTIRLGVMNGVVEKTNEEALQEITAGIKMFQKSQKNPTLKQITFVVYNNKTIFNLLSFLSKQN